MDGERVVVGSQLLDWRGTVLGVVRTVLVAIQSIGWMDGKGFVVDGHTLGC